MGSIRLTGLRPTRFLLCVLLGSVAVVSGVALSGVAAHLICRAAQQPPILTLTTLMVTVRALALLRPLSRYGERLASHDLAFRSLSRLRVHVFERVEPLAPGELEHYRDGELLSRLVSDVDELQDLVLRIVLPAAVAALSLTVIVMGTSAVLLPAGVALALGTALAGCVPPLVASRMAAREGAHQGRRRALLTEDLIEALDAADELWLNGADSPATDRIAADDAELVRAARSDSRAAGVSDALGIALQGVTTLVVLMVATRSAASGVLDPLLVAPLTLVALAAFEATAPLATAGRLLPSTMAAVDRLAGLLQRRPRVKDPAEPAPPPARRAPIALTGVTATRGFGPGRAPVLRGVDLDLAPGERAVVSGPSGAGKSTILQLLVRFFERDSGDALLDDHDLRDFAQEDVRREVLLIEQDPHVFNSNLRENVALARPGTSDEQMIVALEQAQLGEWLASLPEGLDTMVGEHGRALSGGQRQRLAMARAFMANPSILLLDEPTTHLDVDTAQRLLTDLWDSAGNRSVLLVSHADPGPFAECKRIQVVAGRTTGTHARQNPGSPLRGPA